MRPFPAAMNYMPKRFGQPLAAGSISSSNCWFLRYNGVAKAVFGYEAIENGLSKPGRRGDVCGMLLVPIAGARSDDVSNISTGVRVGARGRVQWDPSKPAARAAGS
jgi:hypothetical protein